jgi:uncharacterized cupin superfamily protein
MLHVNLANAEFTYDESDPEGFRSGMFRFREDTPRRTGATAYELPPGQAVCPYHYELAEEEWLMAIEGTPTLRTPEGEQRLEPLDVVFFPTGAEGAHKITNETDSTVRVLIWSEVVYPAATVYPDSDKLGVFTADREDNLMVKRSSGVEYFEGEA